MRRVKQVDRVVPVKLASLAEQWLRQAEKSEDNLVRQHRATYFF